jgi:DNA repair protein SbcD/Mre11
MARRDSIRLLHTSDWHVGKTIRGHSRLEEHRAVLAEIVAVAAAERVDVVLVVGDLYESAAPAPDAQRVVNDALLALRATGAEVVVVAGNHDHAPQFESTRPLFAAAGITMLGHLTRPDDGIVRLNRNGIDARIALAPFVSQRWLLKAEELMRLDAAAAVGRYTERMHQIIGALTEPLRADASGAVTVVAAHAFVRGGRLGGGERDAQTVYEYGIEANAFPAFLDYVALGHLHRHQEMPAATRVVYCGSPIAVDFGEESDAKGVVVADLAPKVPAQLRFVPLTSPAELRTISGTLDQLTALRAAVGDAWLRVRVHEARRAGLADDVRQLFGERAVEIQIRPPDSEPGVVDAPHATNAPPQELFSRYLVEQGVSDERVEHLFAELLDEVGT